ASGTTISERTRLMATMQATITASSIGRGWRTSSLRILTVAWSPIRGSRTPKATRPAMTASRIARGRSTRACTGSAMSDLFDLWPAEQALRQEDQDDREDREGGDVLVVDREIGRPE